MSNSLPQDYLTAIEARALFESVGKEIVSTLRKEITDSRDLLRKEIATNRDEALTLFQSVRHEIASTRESLQISLRQEIADNHSSLQKSLREEIVASRNEALPLFESLQNSISIIAENQNAMHKDIQTLKKDVSEIKFRLITVEDVVRIEIPSLNKQVSRLNRKVFRS